MVQLVDKFKEQTASNANNTRFAMPTMGSTNDRQYITPSAGSHPTTPIDQGMFGPVPEGGSTAYNTTSDTWANNQTILGAKNAGGYNATSDSWTDNQAALGAGTLNSNNDTATSQTSNTKQIGLPSKQKMQETTKDSLWSEFKKVISRLGLAPEVEANVMAGTMSASAGTKLDTATIENIGKEQLAKVLGSDTKLAAHVMAAAQGAQSTGMNHADFNSLQVPTGGSQQRSGPATVMGA